MVKIRLYHPTTGVGVYCKLFGKSRQAFYDHQWRDSNENMHEAIILSLVRQVRITMPRLGSAKVRGMIKEDLLLHGIAIGRDSFATLLRNNNLQVTRRKKYTRTTDSNHPYYKWPDLTASVQPNKAGQLWVSDITYLRIDQGFIYLSLITDAYSRKIVGYHLSQHLKAQSCIISLDKAVATRQPHIKLIHHSDRGIQYCCEQYVTRLQQNNIEISMTQNGSPYENAIAERVNGILKTELGLDRTFASYNAAIAPTHGAIDTYNRLRPHMSCGFLTPDKAHLQTGNLKKAWK